jgi:hypothetical protein
MPNIKYLYGQKDKLGTLLLPSGKLRFKDINKYSDHENEEIRDDESKREFRYPLDRLKHIQVGQHIIPKSDIKGLTLTKETERCHVLCMSNKGFDPILFERFKANICLAINLDILVEILESTFEKNLTPRIVSKMVSYFEEDQFHEVSSLSKEELVFWKDRTYKVEEEHRIAIFLPFGEKTVATQVGGKTFRVYSEEKNLFELESEVLGGIAAMIVVHARTKEGDIIFNNEDEIKLLRDT